jgi:hypothetical protein
MALSGAFILYLPCASVIDPVVVPFTITLTPGKGLPASSRTVPVITACRALNVEGFTISSDACVDCAESSTAFITVATNTFFVIGQSGEYTFRIVFLISIYIWF